MFDIKTKLDTLSVLYSELANSNSTVKDDVVINDIVKIKAEITDEFERLYKFEVSVKAAKGKKRKNC